MWKRERLLKYGDFGYFQISMLNFTGVIRPNTSTDFLRVSQLSSLCAAWLLVPPSTWKRVPNEGLKAETWGEDNKHTVEGKSPAPPWDV